MPWPRSPGYVSGLRPTEQQGTNPKDEYGMAKVPFGLVSVPAQVLQAVCMAVGAEQYGPYNYRVSKVQGLIYLEAALRHLKALIDGQDFDVKTGLPHIGFVLATAGIYADAWINGFLIDNRPLPGRGGDLIELLNRKPGDPERTPEQTRQLIEDFVKGGLNNVHSNDESDSSIGNNSQPNGARSNP